MNRRSKFVILVVIPSLIIMLSMYLVYDVTKNIKSADNSILSKIVEGSDPSLYEDLYISIKSNKIDIYAKELSVDGSRYIGYHLIRDKKELNKNDVASNYDVWKLNGASEYKRNKYDIFREELEIITKGEWEMAIREEGANDFFGGNAHGDEILTSYDLYIDGKQVDLATEISGEANELQLVTTSDLFRDNTTTETLELLGSHQKKYTFNENGLLLEQEINFSDNFKVDVAYLGMLPALRNDGKTSVTDHYRIDDDLEKMDVSTESEELGEPQPGSQVTLSGEKSGVNASMEIIEKHPDIPNKVLVWNAPRYNKLYFVYANNGYEVNSGDTWSQTTQYHISVNHK